MLHESNRNNLGSRSLSTGHYFIFKGLVIFYEVVFSFLFQLTFKWCFLLLSNLSFITFSHERFVHNECLFFLLSLNFTFIFNTGLYWTKKKSELVNQGILIYAAYVLEKTLHVSERLILQVQLVIKTNTKTRSQQLFKISISIKHLVSIILCLHFRVSKCVALQQFFRQKEKQITRGCHNVVEWPVTCLANYRYGTLMTCSWIYLVQHLTLQSAWHQQLSVAHLFVQKK